MGRARAVIAQGGEWWSGRGVVGWGGVGLGRAGWGWMA